MEFHTIHTFQSMKNIIKRYIAKEQPSHTPIGVGNSIHFMLLYYLPVEGVYINWSLGSRKYFSGCLFTFTCNLPVSNVAII